MQRSAFALHVYAQSEEDIEGADCPRLTASSTARLTEYEGYRFQSRRISKSYKS